MNMYYYRPRFGIFRRVFWFGLGIGAAHWWIRSHERREGYCRNFRRPLGVEGAPQPTAYTWPSAMTPTPGGSPPAPPSAHEHVATVSGTETSAPEHIPTERRGPWGWRYHRRHSAPANSDPVEQQQPVSPPHYDDTQAEVERLQRAAEALWEQRKGEALDATVAARDSARDFAIANLQRLTALLERIGTSLEEEKKRAEERKRWV